jgi:ABC-2 type transport system permease protein
VTAVGRMPATAPAPVPRFSRIYGLGSVYAKGLRDARLTFLIMAGMLGAYLLIGCLAFGQAYGTPESRAGLKQLVDEMPPIMAGFTGNPINIETLGGSVSWKYGPFFTIIAAVWSILALSGTLSSEARRGSLEFVAVAPFGKRRIAIEKVAAHLTVMTGVMAVVALAAWAGGTIFASLPGDPIEPDAAIGFALWVGLIALASGSVAFALSTLVGRAGAAGVAGLVMMVGFLLNGYRASVPAFGSLANLTWFGWTAGHVPLARQFDWISLVPVAIAAVVLLAIGIEAFARRDLGDTGSLHWPGLPAATLGLGGPAQRSLGERLPVALAWGTGIGIWGLVIGGSARSFSEELAKIPPDTMNLFRTLIPDIDLTSAGGFLQLAFVQFGFIAAGFAAATLVAGWGSDETSGRVEMLLTTPLARARWAVAGGVGVMAAIGVLTVVTAIGIGVGAAIGGGDIATPILGTGVLGLYAAAVAGIGLAVGGIVGGSIAGEVVAVVVIATFLIDFIAPALQLPDWVHQLALTAHMGQPMVGTWDWTGMIVFAFIAVAGVALSGWGVARRDVNA